MNTRDAQFAELLADSYGKLLGRPLVPEGLTGSAVADWLYEAPFGLLAHDTSPDPLFVYANRSVQRLFEYDWDELVGLPSRLSAGEEDQQARQVLLENVHRQGYAEAYRGLRGLRGGETEWDEGQVSACLRGAPCCSELR